MMLNTFLQLQQKFSCLPTYEKRIENCVYLLYNMMYHVETSFSILCVVSIITEHGVYACLVIQFSSFFFPTADDKDTIRPPGMGRITGSASIETLVRVGIEKENGLSPDSKMIVLHDFTPCVDDELEVKQGNVSFAYIHMFSVCAALMIPRVFPGCERAVPRKRLGLCHWRRSTRRFYSSFVLCSLYATSWRNDADCKKEITKRFGHSQRDRH